MKGCTLLLCVFVVQLALGDHSDVYYWRPNSNWKNPSNWELGKPPCGNQIASIPDNSVIYLNEDVSVQTLMLPENGQIILGANIALTLSDDSSCENDGPGQSDSGDTKLMNGFIGNTAHYWECSENWLNSDNFPAEHPPCGEDSAVFGEDLYFHYVLSNETIRLRSLKVRGQQITSSSQLDSNEFQLNLVIVPECADDPSLCPCPSSTGCAKPPVVSVGGVSSNAGTVTGIVVGLLLALILLVVVVIVAIIALKMYRRRTTVGLYQKDDLLDREEQPKGKEETIVSAPDSHTFDNPVYETVVIPSGVASNLEKPKLDFQPQDDESIIASSNYEAVDDVKPSPGEEEFVKVDLGALEVALEVTEPTEEYETMEDNSEEFFEEETKKGKKKHGKYERF